MKVGAFVITILCICSQMAGLNVCYAQGSPIHTFILYNICHANWWHLGLNMMALWSFKPRNSTLLLSFIVAVISAWVDSLMFGEQTCGLSALICAACARRAVAWREGGGKTILILLIGAVVPGINWHIHVISYVIGYDMWLLYYFIKELSETKNTSI